MKKYTVLFFLAISILPVFAGGSQQENRPLTWSLALQNVKTGDLLPFSAPVDSWDGEQFRLIIKADDDCFCYVVAESPDGEDVTVLYSGPLKNGETWYSPVIELTMPGGSESLFIVASREEQKNLAQRISALGGNSSSVQRRAVINEVFRLRSEVSQFREEPEKPVLMGGAARGSPDKSGGVEFTGLETYVKTISIEH